MLDLHTHSHASDGSFSPTELIAAANADGLRALALTDHDTIAGLEEGFTSAQNITMEFIPGLEISLEGPSSRHAMHLLGLWIDHQDQNLLKKLAFLQETRNERNAGMIKRFHHLGMPLELAEVQALAGTELVGRPHFALALLKRGWVSSLEEGFRRYLARGAAAYLPKYRLSPAEGLAVLRANKALPVLAHPCSLGLDGRPLEKLLRKLKDWGLEGLEVYYSEHRPTQTRQYLDIAQHLNLAVSGGSDFHGEAKPTIQIGRGRGNLLVPDELLEPLRQRRQQI